MPYSVQRSIIDACLDLHLIFLAGNLSDLFVHQYKNLEIFITHITNLSMFFKYPIKNAQRHNFPKHI